MKAAVYHGKHNLVVEDVPVRELDDNEVLVEVKYCGVCGTDIHIFNGDGGSFEVTPPLIPGHEFSGVVKKIGVQSYILQSHHTGQCIPPYHDKSAKYLLPLHPGSIRLHGSLSQHPGTYNKIHASSSIIHSDILFIFGQRFVRRTNDLIYILKLFQTVCTPSDDTRCRKDRCIK